MKWDYLKILTDDCSYLKAKCFFFAIAEEWLASTSEEDLFLKKTFIEIKNKYSENYYQAIFHVLSCPFCLEQSPVLRARSHSQLWKLQFREISLDFARLIQQASQKRREEDEALYYLGLLHEKIANHEVFSLQRNCLPAAAGNSEELTNLPRELLANFALPSDMEIICQQHAQGYEIRIQCSVPIKLTMIFRKNNKQLFELNVSQRIPKKLVPFEAIKDWDEIHLLRVK